MTVLRVEEVTYKGKTNNQLVGTCKLVSKLSEKDLSYPNKDGETKYYKLANMQAKLPNGNIIDITASVPQRNQEIMEENGGEFTVGESYLTTITAQEDKKNPGKLIFFARMSHLQGGGTDNTALAEAFGDSFSIASAPAVEASQEAPAVEA